MHMLELVDIDSIFLSFGERLSVYDFVKNIFYFYH